MISLASTYCCLQKSVAPPPRRRTTLVQKILLTSGKFVHYRQIVEQYNTKARLEKGVSSKSILSEMQSLSDLGYGKLHNEVFYKSPNPSKEMMKVYDIEIEQYLYKLEDSTTPKRCAFPKSIGTEHCMALYHLFMDTKDPQPNK